MNTQADALSAMGAAQRAFDRRNLLGNEGPLDALQAAVVVALKRNDFAEVVDLCGRLVKEAAKMPLERSPLPMTD